MRKLNKKEIESVLDAFEVATELKAEDNKAYFLKSNYGVIKVTFDLCSDYIPAIFTKLLKVPGVNARGFNPHSGKRNYFGLDAIYHFINYDIMVDDIIKDNDIKTAKITKSIFNKDMYDISVSNGKEMLVSVVCIDYKECIQTAANLRALVA